MREIKFRAWFEIGKEMLTWEKENRLLCGLVCIHPSTHILMQYTGLTDKNNKEIYEGDILGMKDIPKTDKYEVGFFEGCWTTRKYHGLELPTEVEYLFEHERHGNLIFLEVIGNIYENPELLKS